jgi:hypothetical protein
VYPLARRSLQGVEWHDGPEPGYLRGPSNLSGVLRLVS